VVVALELLRLEVYSGLRGSDWRSSGRRAQQEASLCQLATADKPSSLLMSKA
jgi:hypothetical protein